MNLIEATRIRRQTLDDVRDMVRRNEAFAASLDRPMTAQDVMHSIDAYEKGLDIALKIFNAEAA